jgi:hypothetical protein
MAEQNVCFSRNFYEKSRIDQTLVPSRTFTYVEINGLRIPEPSAAYGLLWEAISGHDTATDVHLRLSSKVALKHLSRHFGSPRRGPSRARHVWPRSFPAR